MAKSVIEVLTEARAKVAQGWTQRAFARNEAGEGIWANEPDACRWCSMGAIQVASQSLSDERRGAYAVLEGVSLQLHNVSFITFNDTKGRTQAEVLELFDKAIAKASEPKVTTEEIVRG